MRQLRGVGAYQFVAPHSWDVALILHGPERLPTIMHIPACEKGRRERGQSEISCRLLKAGNFFSPKIHIKFTLLSEWLSGS